MKAVTAFNPGCRSSRSSLPALPGDKFSGTADANTYLLMALFDFTSTRRTAAGGDLAPPQMA
jgi:hypothetical protein